MPSLDAMLAEGEVGAGPRRRPERTNGYAAIRDYAAIGDGRTAALVALDGAIDWLCVPQLDSPSVFGALLDAQNGGSFRLAPTEPYEASRRYLPGTNVLETRFTCSSGSARVVDAFTLPGGRLGPDREVVRRLDGLSGSVELAWRVAPSFDYGRDPGAFALHGGVHVAGGRATAIGVLSFGAGDPEVGGDGSLSARFTLEGGTGMLVLAAAHEEPLVLPTRDDAEARLAQTISFWRDWTAGRDYEGPWREAVIRSALALKLLVHAPSGAIPAAATMSLPEEVGGERNFDYRFAWIRDAAFTIDALLELGCKAEAHSFFWWLIHASALTAPRLNPIYRLDGGSHLTEQELELEGYLGSTPVRLGNKAVHQRQLDIYGELLETAWEYVRRGNELDSDTGRSLARMADLVMDVWKTPDAGIWEVRGGNAQFTHSKIMCWVALDRACRLAERGALPDRTSRWREEGRAIRSFIETRCWSRTKQAYTRRADTDELDANVLLGAVFGYDHPKRFESTIDAIRAELGRGDGPYLLRYTGEDGFTGGEGAFLACSFWLADALARCGRLDEACGLMEELVDAANDVGLYSEEIDPATGAFLGNFPQALTHLSLVTAAVTIRNALEER